ncbi:exocyst complex component 8-like isoform X2 [Dreissena polymorpha]|nr:exocyst complex component 8-like isoform X2 [Dreissena polymorpha]
MPLLEMKQKVQILSDKTAQELKKNVYKNYSQFIETAREISILEGEMYQVSRMLTEQKALMTSMLEMSLVSDKAVAVDEPQKEAEAVNPEEETRRNLAFLLEKVEGVSSVTEVPGRQLVHNGDLAELDMESFNQVQKVHMFLLNDSLMIASWLTNRRGPVRYRFQGLYELDNLAIVNIRDAGAVKNSFKVLMFPDSKIYAADSAKSKRQWLDILEETKKKKLARDKQKKEAALRLAEQQNTGPTTPKKEEASKLDDVDTAKDAMETALLGVDWLQELPENLDMCIAQRDFEGAVDLVEKVNSHLKDCQKTPAVKEFRARIDHRVKQLTEGLLSELQVTAERSLRGGPRAARRAVAQLIRLGKSAQACSLFLKMRSTIIKYNIRQLKFEGATSLYVRCLCGVFFSSLSETGREFHKAFPQLLGCFSAFIVWTKTEMENFITIFKRHVFDSKSSLATISECVSIATNHCAELANGGLDVGFYLDNMISEELEKAILESRHQIIESIKFRAGEDQWRPLNLGTETECSRYVDDMASVGLDIRDSVYNGCFISLTLNTTQFCKTCMVLAQSLLLIHKSEREALVTETLVLVFTEQVRHLDVSLASEKFKNDKKFILKNSQYILEVLMSKIEHMYKTQSILFPPQLVAVNAEYRRLKSLVS